MDDGSIIIFTSSKRPILENTRNGRKTRKEISYPVFEELKAYTADPYWKDFLTRAKAGNLPKNYRFTDGYLNYKYRTKNETLDLSTASQESFDSLKAFLYEHSTLESPTDVQKRQVHEIHEEKDLSFSKIRVSGSRLKIALANYIDKYVKKHHFTSDDVALLEAFLCLHINAGTITNDDVVIQNNLIEDITNVFFHEKSRSFTVEAKPRALRKFSEPDDVTVFTHPSVQSERDYISDDSRRKRKSFVDEWRDFVDVLLGGTKKRGR